MITEKQRVKDIRETFCALKEQGEYVTDKTGCKMIEIVGANFIADEEAIFGSVNQDYVTREIDWYKSQSLNVNDIPGGAPLAWMSCASSKGMINSNYGYLIWSKDNFEQYEHVKNELLLNRESRRAVMIYTRPSIWNEYNKDGMSDYVCTNTVQYMIRNDKLIAVVQMRSCDVLFGFKNDRAWQDYVHKALASDLNVEVGQMIWHVGSLHVYERHFHLIK
jgi:thymidylate synthase